jgi:MarR family transcriptional regulator, negative regulator of the multidrug operon emrRAB
MRDAYIWLTVDVDNSTDRLANLLGATASALTERISTTIDSTGLNAGDAALLNAIGQHEGQRIAEIRFALGLSHPGAVRAVDRLAAAGWVRREVGVDGRSVSLHLTNEGVEMWHRTMDASWSVLQRAVAAISSIDRNNVERALENILGVLTVASDQAEYICRLCNESVCPQERCPVTQSVGSLSVGS